MTLNHFHSKAQEIADRPWSKIICTSRELGQLLAVPDTTPLKLEVSLKESDEHNDDGWRKQVKNVYKDRIVVSRPVSIKISRESKDKYTNLHLSAFHFKEDFEIYPDDIDLNIRIFGCVFESPLYVDGHSQVFAIDESQVNSKCSIDLNNEWKSKNQQLEIYKNTFSLSTAEKAAVLDTTLAPRGSSYGGSVDNVFEKFFFDSVTLYSKKPVNYDLMISVNGEQVSISDNVFETHGNTTSIDININEEESQRAILRNNVFHEDVILSGKLAGLVELKNNKFNGLISIEELEIPSSADVEYEALLGKISILTDTNITCSRIPIKYDFNMWGQSVYDSSGKHFSAVLNASYLYDGNTKGSPLFTRLYKKLNRRYKIIYDVLRQNADTDGANRTFVVVKDLEGKRLSAVYDKNGGFRNLFRYLLNRLMKVYTNHATDPALALLVSFYMVIAFGIFYFFFPSEWDVDSKGKIVGHFKDFIKKNEKGYFKPFIRMTGGLALSLANAFALSLNSFVTLGFGNIPTTGIARYVCILQGFLGWFLLSIFTVALFNQVLF